MGNKYRNKRVGGFDSKKEMNRHAQLAALQARGEISNLQTQVKFPFPLKSMKGRTLSYVADFAYRLPTGEGIVEDVKSPVTQKLPVFQYKWALMQHFHGVTVRVV